MPNFKPESYQTLADNEKLPLHNEDRLLLEDIADVIDHYFAYYGRAIDADFLTGLLTGNTAYSGYPGYVCETLSPRSGRRHRYSHWMERTMPEYLRSIGFPEPPERPGAFYPMGYSPDAGAYV